MSYADSVKNQEGLERWSGVYLTLPGNAHSAYNLKGTKGRTQLRIYPAVVDGVEQPMRLSARPCDFSPWIHAENIVRMAGSNEKFTCFTRVKDRDAKYQGPIARFINSVRVAITKTPRLFPPEWEQWLKRQDCPIPRVELCGLVQGVLYENAGKVFKDPKTNAVAPAHPVIVVLNKTARESLEEKANLEHQGVDPNEKDFSKRFPYNGLVASNHGHLVTINYSPAGGREFAHYTCEIDPNPFPLDPNLPRAEVAAWNELLRFLTEQEQLDLVVKHYPPELVDYVFGRSDLATKLPDGIRGTWDELQRRMTNPQGYSVPGSTPPQAPYTPPTAYTQLSAPAPQYSQPAVYSVPPAPYIQPVAPSVPLPPIPTSTSVPLPPVPPSPIQSAPTPPEFKTSTGYSPPETPFQTPQSEARKRLLEAAAAAGK